MPKATKRAKKKIGKKNVEISIETVMRVARIARLNLTEAEAKKYQKELSEILESFAALKNIKTNAKPSFNPLDVKDVFREDVVEAGLTNEAALANTKHKEKGFFKGPRAV